MKCISCETEINPKWKHAIDINVCPFCGKHIMEEHLKNLLGALASTMEQLQQYSDQLNDWLLSNYSYIKTDSPDLKKFISKDEIKEMRKELDDEEFQEKKKSVVKIKTLEDGKVVEQDVVVEKIQSDDRTKTFHERANNMLKSEKAVDGEPKSVTERTEHYKAVVQKIKKDASKGVIGEAGLASMINDADPEAVAEYQSIIDSGDIVSSAIGPTSDGGDDEEIPGAVLAMATRASNKGSAGGGVNEKDLQSLREMQNKIQGGARRMNSGKGGFFRS